MGGGGRPTPRRLRPAEMIASSANRRAGLCNPCPCDSLGQMLESALNELGELVRRRLAAQHSLERFRARVGIGHPASVYLPMCAEVPWSSSKARLQATAPAPLVDTRVPSVSNSKCVGRPPLGSVVRSCGRRATVSA
jgi:hypothetical protein